MEHDISSKEGIKRRMVVDNRYLRKMEKDNNAPVPRTYEMLGKNGGSRICSNLGLKSGFHQIRIKADDVEKAAFNTSTDSLNPFSCR